MASSEVQICSNALLLLGAETINSFEDENDRATLVANLWPNSLDAILRSHPWNCASEIVQLAPDVATPAFGWSYQFTLPSDCLRVLAVGEEGDHIPYRVRRRRILCDDALLNLEYVFRNEDVPTWDALLVQAAEAYMAMTCAYPITKSASMFEAMTKLWDLKLRQARNVDGQENPPEELGDFPMLAVRR